MDLAQIPIWNVIKDFETNFCPLELGITYTVKIPKFYGDWAFSFIGLKFCKLIFSVGK